MTGSSQGQVIADEGALMRSLPTLALVALLVAGCAPAMTTSSGSPSLVVTPPASARATAAETSGSTLAPTGPAAYRLVVLGDSIATGGEASGGSGFGGPTAAGLGALAGRPIELVNLADPAMDSTTLLQRLRSSETWRATVAGADFVTITVGGNDADPFAEYPAGTCVAGGDPSDCLAAYAPDLEKNLDAIVAEILLLRAGQPTAIRITSPDYNPFIGLAPSPDLPTFAADFGVTFYRQVAEAETAAACAVAQRHGALCADFYHAFNGPDGTKDAAPFLAADHLHPSSAGQQRIAELLIGAGLAPLVASPA